MSSFADIRSLSSMAYKMKKNFYSDNHFDDDWLCLISALVIATADQKKGKSL